MAKKKKKSTRARKKESSINTNLIIGIALIAVLIYGGTHDWFKGITSMSVTGDTTTQLNYADIDGTGGCEISTDKDAYYCGQWVKATLQDGKNTKCYIFINKDNSEWEYWGDITTDDNGEAIKQGPVNEAGNYKIRVLCENQCISNLLDINVICDGSDDDEEQDQEQQQIICEDVELPQYGDLDTLCQEATSCENEECHHYWWWNGKEHKCACTETYFCGQYCYEYFYTSECECPPDSYTELTSKSTYRCIPNGYDTCVDGVPEITGPFPD